MAGTLGHARPGPVTWHRVAEAVLCRADRLLPDVVEKLDPAVGDHRLVGEMHVRPRGCRRGARSTGSHLAHEADPRDAELWEPGGQGGVGLVGRTSCR